MIFLKVEQRDKDWKMNMNNNFLWRELQELQELTLDRQAEGTEEISPRSQHDWDWLHCSRTWWRDLVPPASWFVFVYCSVSYLLTFILNSNKSDNQNQTFIVRSQQERVRNKNTSNKLSYSQLTSGQSQHGVLLGTPCPPLSPRS